MARIRNSKNGALEAAMANLVQVQALFLARMSETDREVAKNRREIIKLRRESAKLDRENMERFARIEAPLLEHSRLPVRPGSHSKPVLISKA